MNQFYPRKVLLFQAGRRISHITGLPLSPAIRPFKRHELSNQRLKCSLPLLPKQKPLALGLNRNVVPTGTTRRMIMNTSNPTRLELSQQEDLLKRLLLDVADGLLMPSRLTGMS